jgi:DNA-binding response OmpR family regulator
MKVMICEQDDARAKVIEGLLNVYHLKMKTLTRSGEFFSTVQSFKPSIIIMNEKFSQSNSGEYLTRLRNEPSTSNTPVIFISDKKEDLQALRDRFAQDIHMEMMQEPFKIKQLRHYIDRWTTFRSLYVRQ